MQILDVFDSLGHTFGFCLLLKLFLLHKSWQFNFGCSNLIFDKVSVPDENCLIAIVVFTFLFVFLLFDILVL